MDTLTRVLKMHLLVYIVDHAPALVNCNQNFLNMAFCIQSILNNNYIPLIHISNASTFIPVILCHALCLHALHTVRLSTPWLSQFSFWTPGPFCMCSLYTRADVGWVDHVSPFHSNTISIILIQFS